jgi:hypothetical protein
MTATAPASARVWVAGGLRDIGYAAATLAWSVVGFTVCVTGISVTASLLALVIGLPVWLGFAHAVRWTTGVDRRLAQWQLGRRVPACYRRPAASGFGPAVRAVTRDPQTWRDVAWLALASVVGFALSLGALVVVAAVAAWVSLPAWYWALSDPRAHDGLTNLGAVVVDTPAEAVTVSAVALVLVPAALLLARGCARAHAGLAARFLAPAPGR